MPNATAAATPVLPRPNATSSAWLDSFLQKQKQEMMSRGSDQKSYLNLCTSSLNNDDDESIKQDGLQQRYQNNLSFLQRQQEIITELAHRSMIGQHKRKFDLFSQQNGYEMPLVGLSEIMNRMKNQQQRATSMSCVGVGVGGTSASSWNDALRKDIERAKSAGACQSTSSKRLKTNSGRPGTSTSKSNIADRSNDTTKTNMNMPVTSFVRMVSDENTKYTTSSCSEVQAVKETMSGSTGPSRTCLIRNVSSDTVVTGKKETVRKSVEAQDSPAAAAVCIPVTERTEEDTIEGQMLLGCEHDKYWLSDLVCLIRENIEVFTANEADVAARSRRGGIKIPISLGRVGIRCVHCAHVASNLKAKGAVSYPNSIRVLHQAVRNWQRYHFNVCSEIPQTVKDSYAALKTTRSHSGNASIKYWVDSAKALGLFDTSVEEGIRFSKDKSVCEKQEHNKNKNKKEHDEAEGSGSVGVLIGSDAGGDSVVKNKKTESVDKSSVECGASASRDLITAEDKKKVTGFVYELMSQLHVCKYTEADQIGKRKARPIGFPGVACKHCVRNCGAGRYFPTTASTLSNNSNPFNCSHVHMMKCQRCPQEVKDRLTELQKTHTDESLQLSSEWKKKFFDDVWKRIHCVKEETELTSSGLRQSLSSVSESAVTEPTAKDVGDAAIALSSLANIL